MRKIVVECPSCKKKMKIIYKPAKYKCPNCQSIYKFNTLRKFIFDITTSFTGWKSKMAYRYQSAKAAAQYMKMMKEQQKRNKNAR